MSLRATSWAWELRVGKPVLKVVLMHVADSYNEKDRASWFSINRMAERCECDRKTVIRHLQTLCDMGVIYLVERGNIHGKTNRYCINFDYEGSPKKGLADDAPVDNFTDNVDKVVPKRDHPSPTAPPGVVPECHLGSPTVSPKQELTNNRTTDTRGNSDPPVDNSDPDPPTEQEKYCSKVRQWLKQEYWLDPAKLNQASENEILERWHTEGVTRGDLRPVIKRARRSAMKLTELDYPISYLDTVLRSMRDDSPKQTAAERQKENAESKATQDRKKTQQLLADQEKAKQAANTPEAKAAGAKALQELRQKGSVA